MARTAITGAAGARAGATLLMALGAVLAATPVAADLSLPSPSQPSTAVDAWAPYWTLDLANADLPARVGQLRHVSPYWFNSVAADRIEVDSHVGTAPIDDFVATARQQGASIVPTIAGRGAVRRHPLPVDTASPAMASRSARSWTSRRTISGPCSPASARARAV